MSTAEEEFGRNHLMRLAPDFLVGELSFDDVVPLRKAGRLAARVSREILEDLQGSPQLGGTLRAGVDLARQEAVNPNPRLVLIDTAGVRFSE